MYQVIFFCPSPRNGIMGMRCERIVVSPIFLLRMRLESSWLFFYKLSAEYRNLYSYLYHTKLASGRCKIENVWNNPKSPTPANPRFYVLRFPSSSSHDPLHRHRAIVWRDSPKVLPDDAEHLDTGTCQNFAATSAPVPNQAEMPDSGEPQIFFP